MNETITKRGDNNAAKRAIVALLCLAALVIGGVFAYLTATDTVVNKLSLATKLDIEVVEPNWNPENAVDLLPTEEVTKDPAIHNLTDKEMWVFADVVIPTKNIVVADENGQKQPQAVVDLFTFEPDTANWTLKDTIVGDGTVTYRYAYNQVLGDSATTPSIFDKVKVCNYVDGQIDTQSAAQEIIINGVGVQKEGFATSDDAYKAYFGGSESSSATINKLIVNDEAIAEDGVYKVQETDSKKDVSTGTAPMEDRVIFDSVPVEANETYQVVDESNNKVTEFTADANTITTAQDGKDVVIGGTAFVVYSEDDESLSFYKRSKVPAKDSMYEGRLVSNVYLIDENAETDSESSYTLDWGVHTNAKTLTVVDAGIQPKSINSWFSGFEQLNTINVSRLDVSQCKDFAYAFAALGFSAQNGGLKDGLDISTWDMSNATGLNLMFWECSGVTPIYANHTWDNVIANNANTVVFSSCSGLVGGQGTAYDNLIKGDESQTFSKYAHIDGGSENPGYFTEKSASTATAYAVYSGMDKSLNFYKGSDLPVPGERLNKTIVTKVYPIDENNCAYESAPWANHLNSGTEAVESVSVVDEGIQPTSLSNWFMGAAYKTIDVTKLDVSKATSLYSCFANTTFKTLDISTWDMSNVQDFGGMFAENYDITTIYGNNSINSTNTEDMMFFFTQSLVGGSGTQHNNSSMGSNMAHIDGGTSNPGYFTAKV